MGWGAVRAISVMGCCQDDQWDGDHGVLSRMCNLDVQCSDGNWDDALDTESDTGAAIGSGAPSMLKSSQIHSRLHPYTS